MVAKKANKEEETVEEPVETTKVETTEFGDDTQIEDTVENQPTPETDVAVTAESLREMKPPKEVVDELKEFSETTKTEMPEIKEKYYDILVESYLDHLGKSKERFMQASKILMATFAEKMSGQTAEMEIKVIEKTAIRTYEKEEEVVDEATGTAIKKMVEKYSCTMYVIASGTEGSDLETKFGILNFWGEEACSLAPKFEVDGCYKVEVGVKEFTNRYALSINDATTTIESIELDVPPVKEIMPIFFPPIPVSQAAFNIGEKGDLVLIRGRVDSSNTTLTKKGDMMGILNLFEDTVQLKDIKADSNNKIKILFFQAPEMAIKWMTGSEVLVLCEISQKEGYAVSGFGSLVIPIIGIPNKASTPPPAKPSSSNPTSGNGGW